MRQNEGPPEPWRSFFNELDQLLETPLELHCFGGFTLIHAYGIARTTNDIDFISLVPHSALTRLCELAGPGSELHRKHRLYLDPVALATPPEDYLTRLIPLFPLAWQRILSFHSKRTTSPSQSSSAIMSAIARMYTSLRWQAIWIERCLPRDTGKNYDPT